MTCDQDAADVARYGTRMDDVTTVCNQVNLVVSDMDAALAFYETLGVPARFDGGEWPAGSGARHTALDNGAGLVFELDNVAMARLWHDGWRGRDRTARPVVLTFSVPTRAAVDDRYRALVAAGHRGVHGPADAFFGARFAVVRDPDGNDVGIMSPIDQRRRFTPVP